MADMLNTRALDHSVTEIDYKPISGWAVAALTIAGLYVLIVGTIAATALYEKRPALSVVWVILAVIGLILSIVARIHIKRSEGTRAGLKQAAIAWWLSVMGGAAFGAYIYASKIALEKQAEDFSREWFTLLKQGKDDSTKLNEAFLLMMPPNRRQGIDPEAAAELGAAQWPEFRNSELVRLFERYGDDIAVVAIGVSNWQQIDTGYQIDYAFQVRSPEGIVDLNLILFGSEGKDFVGRQWHVAFGKGAMTTQSRTTYGRLLNHMQDEAREVGEAWQFNLGHGREGFEVNSRQGHIADVYAMTLNPAERKIIAAFNVAQIGIARAGGLPIGTFSLLANASGIPPTNDSDSEDRLFHALQNNGFFTITEKISDEKKTRLRDAFRFKQIMKAGESRHVNLDTAPQISVTAQEIRYSHPIEFAVPSGNTSKPPIICGGRLIIVSQNPQIIAELFEQQAKGKANPTAKDETPINLLATRPPRDWRILRLESNLEPLQMPKTAAAQGGPDGLPPGGPGGPAPGGKN